jgi:hypothetical protein
VIKFEYKDIDANFITKITLPVPVCGNRDILTSLILNCTRVWRNVTDSEKICLERLFRCDLMFSAKFYYDYFLFKPIIQIYGRFIILPTIHD